MGKLVKLGKPRKMMGKTEKMMICHLVNIQKRMGKSPNAIFMGKSTISTGPCSMSQTVSHYQRVRMVKKEIASGLFSQLDPENSHCLVETHLPTLICQGLG